MTRRFTQWLGRKWQRSPDPGLMRAYHVAFATLHGQLVIQHLVDQIYATVYEGKDPLELAYHNGRRSVIHEILEQIDQAERPDKYGFQSTSSFPVGEELTHAS